MVRPYYLLDTNIISEPVKIRPDKKVLAQFSQKSRLCQIPAPVWHELLYGMNRLQNSRKKDLVSKYLFEVVLCQFPVVAYDEHAAWIHADIRSRLENQGLVLPLIDSQIAAIAVANNMVLVTQNTRDYAAIVENFSLIVENWFE